MLFVCDTLLCYKFKDPNKCATYCSGYPGKVGYIDKLPFIPCFASAVPGKQTPAKWHCGSTYILFLAVVCAYLQNSLL